MPGFTCKLGLTRFDGHPSSGFIPGRMSDQGEHGEEALAGVRLRGSGDAVRAEKVVIGLDSEVRGAATSGLAFGVALAVRPAGSAEVSRVNGARRRVPRSGMRSTVEAGGADLDNARRSGPGTVIFRRHLVHPTRANRPGHLVRRMTHGALRRMRAAAGCGASAHGQRPRRCATAQEEAARLPTTCGENPATHRGQAPHFPFIQRFPWVMRSLCETAYGLACRRRALEAVEKVVAFTPACRTTKRTDGNFHRP